MRSLRGSLSAKIAALVLATVLAAGAALSFIATLAVWNGYGTAPSYFDDVLCRETMTEAMYNALYLITEPDSAMQPEYAYWQEVQYPGLAYEVYYGGAEDGVLLGAGGQQENAAVGREDTLTVETSAPPPADSSEASQGDLLPAESSGCYTVVGTLYQDLPSYGSFRLTYRLYNLLHPVAGISTLLLGLCVLGALLCLVFLLCAAGHRSGTAGIVPNWQDRIPLELYFIGDCVLLYITLVMADSALRSGIIVYNWELLSQLGGLSLCALLGWAILLAALMTVATRLKLGKWWRNSLCYLLLRWVRRLWRRFFAGVRGFVRILPMTWRAVLLAGGVLFLQLLLTLICFDSYANNGFFFLLLLALDAAVLVGAAWFTRQLQQIRDMGSALAAGNLEAKIDTRKMFRDIKDHAENLNAIGTGMTRAVEQRMKSERLKTELITNVSHDIKTPLTSIVNYVDLLGKEELPEKAAEYLAVLDRQSNRLKKLTEDLVEASKASTGNMSVSLQPLVVNEIILQAVGEYDEKLTAGKLEVIVSTFEGNLTALADSRLLWRVLDNLLSNVCKYAMAGSRVYIDLGRNEGRVVLSMKNVSRDRLNISPDELMERFVRGDASRHTEGSGLGLNIARSLMELMGGTFSIAVDGDLFKAELTLPQA